MKLHGLCLVIQDEVQEDVVSLLGAVYIIRDKKNLGVMLIMFTILNPEPTILWRLAEALGNTCENWALIGCFSSAVYYSNCDSNIF
jgi:hypothetical protein